MNVRRITAAVILSVALAGCATTTAFQKSVAHVAPSIAVDAGRYAKADAAIGPTESAYRQSQANVLATTSGSAGDVTAQSAETAWAAVRPWYAAYIAADGTLTASERKVGLARCDYFDRLIAAESGRPLGAGTRPSGG